MFILLFTLFLSVCLCDDSWICHYEREDNFHEFQFQYVRPFKYPGLCTQLSTSNIHRKLFRIKSLWGEENPFLKALNFSKINPSALIKIDVYGDSKLIKRHLSRLFQMIPITFCYRFTFHDVSMADIHEDLLLFQELLAKPMEFQLSDSRERLFFEQQRTAKALLKASPATNIWRIIGKNWRQMAWSMFNQKIRIKNLEWKVDLSADNMIFFTSEKIRFQVKGEIPTKILVSLAVLAHVWKIHLVLEVDTKDRFQQKYYELIGKLLLKDFPFKINGSVKDKKFEIGPSQLVKGGLFVTSEPERSYIIHKLLRSKEHLIQSLIIKDNDDFIKKTDCGSLVFERIKRALSYYSALKTLAITVYGYEYLSCANPFDLLKIYKQIPVTPGLRTFRLTFDADNWRQDKIISQHPIFPFDPLFLLLQKKFTMLSTLSISIYERYNVKDGEFRMADFMALIDAIKKYPIENIHQFRLSIAYDKKGSLQSVAILFLKLITTHYKNIKTIYLKIGTAEVTFGSTIDAYFVEMPQLEYIRVNNYIKDARVTDSTAPK